MGFIHSQNWIERGFHTFSDMDTRFGFGQFFHLRQEKEKRLDLHLGFHFGTDVGVW